MTRLLALLFALLLPLQFAWGAASAYCQHEPSEQQSEHVGHHIHAHQGEAKKSSDGKLTAHSDCASCYASAAAAIPTQRAECDFDVATLSAEPVAAPPFSSALVRAPDRPQWLRLV